MPVQNPFSLQFNGNITEWNSVALGNPTTWGTAATGQVVIGVNAEMFAGTTALSATGTSLNVNITGGTFGGTLSNNTAAPAATNLGVLPAIAETAYTTVTYTTGNQVLPVTDLHGALNQDLQAYAGTQLTGTVTAYGTAPTGNVFGVNAFVTNTVPVTLASTTVTGTVAVTQSTSPWVVSLASTTITGTVTAVGNLTNNNAAPAATLQGVLPAIAETAYNTVTYTTGDMVLPVTDLHGALNQDLQAYAGTQLTGTVTAYGTAPTGNVFGVNAFVTNTVPVTQSTSPWVVSGTVTANQGTSPWVVSLASTTVTGTVAVTQSTSPWVVDGNLTNNNAAPAATNVGVLPAIAETAYTTITYTTGNQVLPVVDLHGAANTDLQAVAGTAVVTAAAGVQRVGIAGSANATLDSTVASGTAPTNALSTSGVYDTTQPAPTNTQATAVQQDQAANALDFPGVQFKTGAAWATGTALNTLQYITGTATIGQPSGAPGVIIQFDQTTTLTAGAVTFQGTYDNINWVTIPVSQILNPQTLAALTNPMTFVASTQTPVLIITQGFVSVRINLTTAITGTGTVTPYWSTIAIAPLISTVVTPSTDGGISAATGSIGATKTAIKTTGGNIYGWYFYNSNVTVAYVQIFNNTVAGTTLGTTAPFMSLGIPPVAGANVLFDTGITLGTAITIAVTTTRGGATGPTNTVDFNVMYL